MAYDLDLKKMQRQTIYFLGSEQLSWPRFQPGFCKKFRPG